MAKQPPPKADPNNRVRKIEALALRHAANLLYVTHHRGISYTEIAKREPFTRLNAGTIAQWGSKYKWPEERQKYFEDLSDGIKKKLGKRLVNIQIELLKKFDVLLETTFDDIDESKPKSKEGMINALVNLVKASNELRDRVAKEIVVESPGGTRDEGMQVTPKLTESEARAAAMAIIHERRAKMRAAATDSDDDEKPQLRVVDGGAGE